MPDNEIRVGDSGNLNFMLGDMGVQQIYVGDTLYYGRRGSFCYIELGPSPSYQQFVPLGSDGLLTSDGQLLNVLS